ncbi:MAG TPA: SH3 domain-containing protein [Pyrinomonadaceae bacterium]|nr:SH3 domain-containing protein [Pyrinomonadaceae bacterium]
MICPKCNTINENSNVFCVTCGGNLTPTANIPPTMLPNSSQSSMPTQVFQSPQNQNDDYLSSPTVFAGQQPNPNQSQANYYGSPQANFNQSQANFNPSMAGFNPSIPYIPQPAPPKSRLGLWIGLSVFLLLLLGGGIGGAIFLLKKTTGPAEVLPDHLGMFFQNKEKTSIEEIKKLDFTNALDGKDKILKDESVPTVESKPNLILYSDGKDIPLGDLKLIQLDSVKPDGTMKQIDFKATPVDGKTEMKRLWFAENLANGKYAFALIDGFFDEGKHKFWAFQVKNSDRADNGNLTKDLTVSLKNKSNKSNTSNSNTTTNSEITQVTPTPKPSVAPPVGSRTAFAATNNVVVRSAPSLSAQKVSGLKRGQKIYVVGYSDNYDYWNGLEGTWANIQTESGQRGWVFSPLIKY